MTPLEWIGIALVAYFFGRWVRRDRPGFYHGFDGWNWRD